MPVPCERQTRDDWVYEIKHDGYRRRLNNRASFQNA
jgi:ATP-dependent DNA ligase